MSQEPKTNIANLRRRAELTRRIREFFYERGVLEVETPLLCTSTGTDVYIDSIQAIANEQLCFLQTSPEYAMKRLLVEGIGDCYQLSKAFRDHEYGHQHNLEFTILEWYRLGFDHHALMDEVDELLQLILMMPKAHRISYQALFEAHLKVNPHEISLDELQQIAKQHSLFDALGEACKNKDNWLMLLMSHVIEPKLGFDAPCFIYDFPATQAALAKVQGNVGERFEVYVKGMELANGFHELQNVAEQRERFERDLRTRAAEKKFLPPMDIDFLLALERGLPACSGVALGVDRLMMLALNAASIDEVISFRMIR
jgi:lysyl-tRNA synthetase class 2